MKNEIPVGARTGRRAQVVRGTIASLAIVCLALLGIAALYKSFKRPASTPVAARSVAATNVRPPEPARTTSAPGRVQPERSAPVAQPARTAKGGDAAGPAAQPQAPGSTARARQLLASLTQFDPRGGVSPEQAAALKQTFKLLAQEGAAAVPAIREYLDRFQDIDFQAAGAEESVGYASLRIGLLDVLGQIGGTEAVDLSLQTLQKTGDSHEIAFLAKMLDKQLPPEQLRPAVLAAASDALTQVTAGKLDRQNVTPLFEVLQKYGDSSVASVLEQAAGRWNYYATLALAGLPDGAGIPSLIRLAQDPALRGAGNGDVALRPLAQAAMEYTDARTALVEQARANQIPAGAWDTVAASLAGNYLQYGDHLFGMTGPSVRWSRDQIEARVALIDDMLSATSDSAGRQALQNARVTVLNVAAHLSP